MILRMAKRRRFDHAVSIGGGDGTKPGGAMVVCFDMESISKLGRTLLQKLISIW